VEVIEEVTDDVAVVVSVAEAVLDAEDVCVVVAVETIVVIWQ